VTITIAVTCLNEEKNLRDTIETIFKANEGIGFDLDIIIVNDGSTDGTLEVARELQASGKNIRIISHQTPKGLGTAFVKGAILARGEYFSLFPGDNEITEEYMKALFSKVGQADLILSYPTNNEIRPRERRIVSKIYVSIYNLLFGLNLKYYNGPAFFKTSVLNDIAFVSRFFSYHSEAVVKFIKKGHPYTEVGGLLKRREHGISTALKLVNWAGVFLGTLILFLDVYFFLRDIYNKEPIRGYTGRS
jgi:glycosyltransferase involved in cell wall biosynthesis